MIDYLGDSRSETNKNQFLKVGLINAVLIQK